MQKIGARLSRLFSGLNLAVSFVFVAAGVVFLKQGSVEAGVFAIAVSLPLFLMEAAINFIDEEKPGSSFSLFVLILVSRGIWLIFCSLMLWKLSGQPNYIYAVAIFLPPLICNYASLMQNFVLRIKEVSKNYPPV